MRLSICFFIFFISSFSVSINISAQKGRNLYDKFLNYPILNRKIELKKDSVIRDKNGLLIVPHQWTPYNDELLFKDTIIFNPAFLPVVFDGKILPNNLDFREKIINEAQSFSLIDPDSTFLTDIYLKQKRDSIRRQYYINNPSLIKLNALRFKNSPVVEERVIEKKSPLHELLSVDNSIEFNTPEVEKIRIKPTYWLKSGEHSLSINQNSLSDNWASGGDNNYAIRNYHKIVIRYQKKKIKFRSEIEWKLNLMRTEADTVHKVSIIDDYFRTYNVLGINAFSKWSYTWNAEVKTPLFNSYPINNEEKRTALFSPLEINAGIGMGYNIENKTKTDKYRKFKLTLDLSPLSINYKFVGDKGVDQTRFGVEKEKRARMDYGSTINLNLTWDWNRHVGISSRFKYFSNYEKVSAESENKFTMKLNRYLATSLGLYVRYDDGLSYDRKDPKWGYFQYNQIVGFGLDYKW